MTFDLSKYPLWTAIITPMHDNSEVDYPSFAKLLKEQEAAENGVLILGSTGEALNIDEEERLKILDFTLEQKLTVPVMVGVGGVNLNETKKWVAHLETLPFHAYLMVTPLYAKPGPVGQYLWFKELLDMASRPVILYNIPSRTGAKMAFEVVEKIRDHKNFYGIKEASGDPNDFKKFRELAPKAMLFSGDDALMPAFSALGANGLISVASNIWPRETHEYTRGCLAQNFSSAQLWQECSEALFSASNPIPSKVLLKELGRISSAKLRAPLTEKELSCSSHLLAANKKIISWYKHT